MFELKMKLRCASCLCVCEKREKNELNNKTKEKTDEQFVEIGMRISVKSLEMIAIVFFSLFLSVIVHVVELPINFSFSNFVLFSRSQQSCGEKN